MQMLIPRPFFITLLLSILFSLPYGSALATTTEKPAKTLSPYFFIEGGDSGVDRLPLKSTQVDVQLNGLIASVKLTQIYRNEGNQPISARYIFPGSTQAAVNGMTMTVGERRIVATIKEKQQAKKVFETAKQAGKSASLLAQKRPNVFSMDVANIMPGDKIAIDLHYTEILVPEAGTYTFVYPGVVGPRYGGDAGHSELPTQWIENPYLKEGSQDPVSYSIQVNINSPLPVSRLESPSHELNTNWINGQEATVSISDTANGGNRDFILRYRLQDNKILTGLTRFQTDEENYFMLVAEPPARVIPEQIPARDYFFVIDVSGSMHGFPLDTSKSLISHLLHNLKPNDRFNILFFAGGSKVLAKQPLTATSSNIARAEAMLAQQRGGGGTNLYSALERVLAMPSDEGRSRNVVLITDGYISAESRVFQLIDQNLHQNNVFAFGIGRSVNRFLIEGVAKAGRAEAFVVTNRTEAERQAQRFHDYIAAPILTNISIDTKGLEAYDLEPPQLPDLLAQRPIMLIGKYRNANPNAEIRLRGISGQGDHQWAFTIQQATDGDSTLPQLWARKRLERLYVIPEGNAEDQRKNILELGLKYSLLTRHTSFVAVDEEIRNTTGSSKDVKQPLPLPQGVSNLAVGRPMPEPELVWIGIMLLLMGGLQSLRRVQRATNA